MTESKPRTIKHFGVRVTVTKNSPKLVKEEYAVINNKASWGQSKYHTDEWCEKHRENCLINFDYNMEFFANLNRNRFNKEVDAFVTMFDFKEVVDLSEYAGVRGAYLMVLDEYCQVYIGVTSSKSGIRGRVMQHWSVTKSFDRLLFPTWGVLKSRLSIDSFRALDTTRLYAYVGSDFRIAEDKFKSFFNDDFVTNRIKGGDITNSFEAMEAIASVKHRQLFKGKEQKPLTFVEQIKNIFKK